MYKKSNWIHRQKVWVLFSIISVVLVGCATHGIRELRAKALMINPGMTKAEVVDILGTPGSRQFQGKDEAWQYKSYGL